MPQFWLCHLISYEEKNYSRLLVTRYNMMYHRKGRWSSPLKYHCELGKWLFTGTNTEILAVGYSSNHRHMKAGGHTIMMTCVHVKICGHRAVVLHLVEFILDCSCHDILCQNIWRSRADALYPVYCDHSVCFALPTNGSLYVGLVINLDRCIRSFHFGL